MCVLKLVNILKNCRHTGTLIAVRFYLHIYIYMLLVHRLFFQISNGCKMELLTSLLPLLLVAQVSPCRI